MKGIVFDLDGTLVRGANALPGAVMTVGALRKRGLRVTYCTQDSVGTPAAIAARLDALGFGAVADDVITAGWAAANYLAERYREEPLYVIGGAELRRIFLARGINLVGHHNAGTARAVFIGRDPEFTAEHIIAACRAIWDGAAFFGVGYDRVLPVANRHLVGMGGVIKAIEYATRHRAHILGKPSVELAMAALRRLNTQPEETVIVGDLIESDIRMGKSARCRTVLVLTGGVTAANARRIPTRSQPDAVLSDVSLLPDWIATAEK